jgi:hypothetical protein
LLIAAAVVVLAWDFVAGKALNWWAIGLLASVGAVVIASGVRRGAPLPSARSMMQAQSDALPSEATNPRLGELLVHKYCLLTQEQLSQALTRQMATGQKLGEILVQMGLLTHSQIAIALADQQSRGDPFGTER